jgi:hypothetical protein
MVGKAASQWAILCSEMGKKQKAGRRRPALVG